ncbi:AP-3 complex subunit beta-2 [Podila epigama]|nr:AP-3 complex subunit beta-2 [Podila epigama]
MARYDLNYDVRDRARFLRALVYGHQDQNKESDALIQDSDDVQEASSSSEQHDLLQGGESEGNGDLGGFEYSDRGLDISQHVKKILLSEKPAPVQENPSQGREQYRVGSMALVLNRTVAGYEPLPDWPTVQPDPSVRRMASTVDNSDPMNGRSGFGSDSFGHGVSSSGGRRVDSVSSSRYDGGSRVAGAQSLDKFLESSSEEDTSSESDSDDDDGSTEDDSESGSEDGSESEEGEEEDSDENDDEDDDDEASSSEGEAILPQSTRSHGMRR